jgi:beta-aspartyl-peptidase (threonine type)
MSRSLTVIRFILLFTLVNTCGTCRAFAESASSPVLVIHGGAGVVRGDMTPESEAAVREALEKALKRGHAELLAGKPALDAVTRAITLLEDDPNFNAGKGAVFTHDGHNELDAAIMDGTTRRAGAIAGVRSVRNPILLARAVMEKSRHVMLAGAGAEVFAKANAVEIVEPAWFRTERRWQQLQKALAEEKADAAHADMETAKHFGTVGAVALDRNGGLAAGTSTGGMTNKRWGRIGDAPLIGAGTYADAHCAVSGTGWGEFYIRSVAAHAICLRVGLLGQSVAEAGEAVINGEVPRLGGDGGAIVLGADGSFAMPFNTDGMFRGWIGADGKAHVAIYADDESAEN